MYLCVINNRDEEYLKGFGFHLRKLREEKNLSQEKLSMLADISENQIYNLENGKNNPTICTLKQIASALKIAPKDLLDF